MFGFPSLVRFSWGTCTTHLKSEVEVAWLVFFFFSFLVASVISYDQASFISNLWLKCLVEFVVFCIWSMVRESDETEENGFGNSSKRQAKLSRFGFTNKCETRSQEIESSGKGRCKFLQARKIQQITQF